MLASVISVEQLADLEVSAVWSSIIYFELNMANEEATTLVFQGGFKSRQSFEGLGSINSSGFKSPSLYC